MNAPTTVEGMRSAARDATTPNQRWVLLESAFHSKHLELVRVGASIEGMLPTLVELWQKEPQSRFKDDVLLIILESRWPTDPSDPPPGVPFRLWAPIMEWACIDVLASRMPDETLSVERFSTLASRKVVAAKFRQVLERESRATPEARTPGEARERQKAGSVESVAMPGGAGTDSKGKTPPGAIGSSAPSNRDVPASEGSRLKPRQTEDRPISLLPFLYVGVGLVVLIVLFWVLVRALRKRWRTSRPVQKPDSTSDRDDGSG